MDRRLPIDDQNLPAGLNFFEGDDCPGVLRGPCCFEKLIFWQGPDGLTRLTQDAGEGGQVVFRNQQGLDSVFGLPLPKVFEPTRADFIRNRREWSCQGIDPIAGWVCAAKPDGVTDLVGCALRLGEVLGFD